MAIGTCSGNEDGVSLCCLSADLSLMAQYITRLANLAHNLCCYPCRGLQPIQVEDVVMRSIQCWSDQRIETGVNAYVLYTLLRLQLSDGSKQYTSPGNKVPARLHPKLNSWKIVLNLHEPLINTLKLQSMLSIDVLNDPQATCRMSA